MTTDQTLDSQVSQLMQKVEEQKQIVQETESQTKRGWATNCAYSLNGKTVNIQTSSIDICVKIVADIILQSKAISEARGVLGLPYEPVKIDAFTPDDWIEDVKPMETTERMPVTDADGTVLKYVDRETYNKYLSSDVWKRRREKVILRAGGVCEGCLTAPASEVHHLTYRNIYREFAFELVALCRSCHARAHGDK